MFRHSTHSNNESIIFVIQLHFHKKFNIYKSLSKFWNPTSSSIKHFCIQGKSSKLKQYLGVIFHGKLRTFFNVVVIFSLVVNTDKRSRLDLLLLLTTYQSRYELTEIIIVKQTRPKITKTILKFCNRISRILNIAKTVKHE